MNMKIIKLKTCQPGKKLREKNFNIEKRFKKAFLISIKKRPLSFLNKSKTDQFVKNHHQKNQLNKNYLLNRITHI